MALREPVGVIVGMAPWNAPVILGTRAVAMPLACGNAVVLKASELCPATHRMIVETLNAAGLPKGVLNVITHAAEDAPEVVSALIAHPKVRRINFTGSTRVGRIIAEQAGRHLKPALLELGGKAPLVVLDDADLDGAVNAAVFGAFMNQGQICMSTEKIVVDAQGRRRVRPPPRRARGGAALRRSLGAGRARLAGQPRGGRARGGADRRRGGEGREPGDRRRHRHDDHAGDRRRPGDARRCGSTPRNRSGPIVAVVRVDGVEQAVAAANDGDYGLAAAVFGRDVQPGAGGRAPHRVGDRPRQRPDGAGRGADALRRGQGFSGYGRFGGKAGIDAFTELRWVSHRGRRPALSVLTATAAGLRAAACRALPRRGL